MGLTGRNRAFGVLPEVDPGRKKELAAFQRTAGIRFRSLELLNLSFTHRSVSNETGSKINNERLEFLGDSILGAVTASLLYETYPDKTEGELAKIKAVVVSEDVLSGAARVLQIDNMLILGRGEDLSGGRTKKAILADALEALIGALYLDSGYKAAFTFVSHFISLEIDQVVDNNTHRDYKSLARTMPALLPFLSRVPADQTIRPGTPALFLDGSNDRKKSLRPRHGAQQKKRRAGSGKIGL